MEMAGSERGFIQWTDTSCDLTSDRTGFLLLQHYRHLLRKRHTFELWPTCLVKSFSGFLVFGGPYFFQLCLIIGMDQRSFLQYPVCCHDNLELVELAPTLWYMDLWRPGWAGRHLQSRGAAHSAGDSQELCVFLLLHPLPGACLRRRCRLQGSQRQYRVRLRPQLFLSNYLPPKVVSR